MTRRAAGPGHDRQYLPGVVSVIVPAHNEARVIGRLLGQLVSNGAPDELDVIVVANGCADDTASVAASFGSPVRVLSIPATSKREALVARDQAACGFRASERAGGHHGAVAVAEGPD